MSLGRLLSIAAPLLCLAFGPIFAAGATPAQLVVARCLPQKDMEARLLQDYGERLAGWGATAGGGFLLEHFEDPADGSWTVVLTDPAGTSCIMATGEAWQVEDWKEGEAT